MAINDTTTNLNLPLPHADNPLEHDVERVRDAFAALDTAVAAKADASDLDLKADASELEAKADLVDGKVPLAQMPSDVDDVVEVPNFSQLPATGVGGKLYITVDDDKLYHWKSGAYAIITGSPDSSDDVPEGAANLYFTALRARSAQLPATAAALGVVRVGAGLSVGLDGVLSVVGSGGSGGVPAFNELPLIPSAPGQKVFTPAGGYSPGAIDVFLNGVLLYPNGDDYTASDGETIALVVGANPSDTILLRRWTTADTLPFSSLSAKPTTLAGYGITDAAPKASPAFTGSIAANGSVRSAPVAVAAMSIDCSTGNYFTKTISANSVFAFSGVPASGTRYAMTIEINHTGGVFTFPAGVIWPNSQQPTFTAGKVHLVHLSTTDGGAKWRAGALSNYPS